MRFVAAIVGAIALAAHPAKAGDLAAWTAFVCTFDRGQFVTVEHGRFAVKPAGESMTMTFAAIDLAAGKAEAIGNLGLRRCRLSEVRPTFTSSSGP